MGADTLVEDADETVAPYTMLLFVPDPEIKAQFSVGSLDTRSTADDKCASLATYLHENFHHDADPTGWQTNEDGDPAPIDIENTTPFGVNSLTLAPWDSPAAFRARREGEVTGSWWPCSVCATRAASIPRIRSITAAACRRSLLSCSRMRAARSSFCCASTRRSCSMRSSAAFRCASASRAELSAWVGLG